MDCPIQYVRPGRDDNRLTNIPVLGEISLSTKNVKCCCNCQCTAVVSVNALTRKDSSTQTYEEDFIKPYTDSNLIINEISRSEVISQRLLKMDLKTTVKSTANSVLHRRMPLEVDQCLDGEFLDDFRNLTFYNKCVKFLTFKDNGNAITPETIDPTAINLQINIIITTYPRSLYKCPLCEIASSSITYFRKHIRNLHKNFKLVVICITCQKSGEYGLIARHYAKCVGKTMNDSAAVASSAFQCSICKKKSFKTRQARSQHKVDVHLDLRYREQIAKL